MRRVKAEQYLDNGLRLLQGAIRATGYTQTEIDERIGRRRGYLSHVFQRRVDLKVGDLLRILQVLSIDPRLFFLAATSPEPAHGTEVLRLIADSFEPVAAAHPAAAPPGAAVPLPAGRDEELLERVRAVVRSVLERG